MSDEPTYVCCGVWSHESTEMEPVERLENQWQCPECVFVLKLKGKDR